MLPSFLHLLSACTATLGGRTAALPRPDHIHDALGDIHRRFITTWRETGPVVEVDDAKRSIRINNAIATIDFHTRDFGSAQTLSTQFALIESKMTGRAVDLFVAIF